MNQDEDKTNRAGYARHSPLGENVDAPEEYSPSVLFAIEREAYRSTLTGNVVPMYGADTWHCYELSWLSKQGKPEIAVMRLILPASSRCIVESKSLKLYLASLNNSRFESAAEVQQTIYSDLNRVIEADFQIAFIGQAELRALSFNNQDGFPLDSLHVTCDALEVSPETLCLSGQTVSGEHCFSELFRSNCPVTGQPDWASLSITYSGSEFIRESLLQYVVSYRKHNGFHEQCVEQVYRDLWHRGNLEQLTVTARYTRRGGIDITPCRSSSPDVAAETARSWRQ